MDSTTIKEPFDDTAKQFYRSWFLEHGMKVKSEVEVFFRSRMIDLTVECTLEQQKALQSTVFDYFQLLNLLEFKGDGDPLTLKDLNLILMRAWAIGAMEFEQITTADLSLFPALHPALLAHERYQLPSQRTVTIISVKRPDKLLNDLSSELRFRATDEPGIYLCEQLFPIRIICPRELSLQPKNYPLLPLAKGKKLEQFIDICLRDGLATYLQLIIDIGLATDPEMIWKKLLEASNMTIKMREETWSIIDQFFKQAPHAFQKLPTIRETIQQAAKDSEERGWQRGIQMGEERGIEIGQERGIEIGQERGIEIGQERGIEIGQERGERRAEQQTLIRLLQRKFGPLPESVISEIQGTMKSQQLEQWLDQVLDATSLQEMGFFVSPQNGKPMLNGA